MLEPLINIVTPHKQERRLCGVLLALALTATSATFYATSNAGNGDVEDHVGVEIIEVAFAADAGSQSVALESLSDFWKPTSIIWADGTIESKSDIDAAFIDRSYTGLDLDEDGNARLYVMSCIDYLSFARSDDEGWAFESGSRLGVVRMAVSTSASGNETMLLDVAGLAEMELKRSAKPENISRWTCDA